VGRYAIKLTNSPDSVKRNAHGNKKLGRGEVYASHHLRSGMLHLKARVELQKIEHVFCMTIKVY
jgi:hypothetical protein